MKNSPRSFKRNAGVSAAMLGVSALLLTGCGAAPEEEADSTGAANANSDFRACIVSDEGGFDDRSFNQSSYEGLKAAEADLGIEVSEAQSQSETDFLPNLDSMISEGCNLTVTVGFLLADATKEVATANPDSNFAIVDDNTIELDNVKPIIYDTAQAAFLAGYVAAGTSETGKVATYGGINIPTVTIFMDGFADGVEYYNEENSADVQLLGWNKADQTGSFVGNFTDTGAGKTTTENFLNEGADIIMPVAGPVGSGTLDAVVEANANGGSNKVVWVDSDGFETNDVGTEFILTSVMKLMGEAVEEVIASDVEGNFDATPYVGTLENGGVALAPYHDQESAVPDDVKTAVDEIKAQIIAGDITVESAASPK
ncbi:BMP family ABC transporter substrate-binding protein [Arthrobacter sp. zg-Y820]|uniref:BMP family lipoprotein n=1 Tax=unclassified Arthrobacter TaxID=235627 RepID=UPI001E463EF1|nr:MULTISPECIES: BMP family ABC transporter substrate-binding protein [unclassified Arthrobacter]MCC9195522.1 BMP family ABC transporter substrate-binding protein [Arthrobacter sp. zg-Y820]MDK1278381.1 BMP family ABC transporter substrate-binding protein [Arthrobacter sp. zg.Y820]MDK1360070.1 BMP family ABC transporter substrate-binding protein [Arthrobacter sp. zg-Y1219]WIB10255.1 BMP family ABC transporter substrate-binding protein [Arthrobacter sp. zg-Y820]